MAIDPLENRKWEPEEGLMLWFFKRPVTLPFSVYQKVVNRVFPCLSDKATDGVRHCCLDMYYFVWLILLFTIYDLMVERAADKHAVQTCFQLFWVVVSFWRVYEGTCVAVLLHCGSDPYRTSSMPRAVACVLMQYLHTIIAFGTLYAYLSISPVVDKPHGFGERFASECTTPLFYSFTTITTLGHGVFSPVGFYEQLAVTAEVCIGIILLVIILDRALNGQSEKYPNVDELLRWNEKMFSRRL